ncbi:hypothetical protein [Noviherbaspirillum pedocola]|uniref:Uncharacterized protein n=1 Tax=Noviherbaspirillum pedocola TaxID=2801341 RepID=A0A934SZV5_9BURK|nr:hypothetical protein [Noviherbaspirillum pedocola]MBK4736097.1 hypothetical protein [Noviherbaspirillum pedocola]
MSERYIDQPVLSSSEVHAFFQQHGMDIERWPQVVPPAEVVEEYKKEVALNEAFFKDIVDADMLSQLSKDSLAEAELPCPLIRTKWGCLMVADSPAGSDVRGHLSVQIYVAPAWRHADVKQGRMVLGTLLDDPIKQFNSMLRSAGAKKGNRVSLSEGINGALVSVDAYFQPSKNDEAAKAAAAAISHFFIWISMHELLDEAVKYVGLALPAASPTGLLAGMLRQLQ